jgi:hypothetical protein
MRMRAALRAVLTRAVCTARSEALRALAGALRAACDSRKEGKAWFEKQQFAPADAAYSRGLSALADASRAGPPAPGTALLLCNRAAARAALGRHAEALEGAPTRAQNCPPRARGQFLACSRGLPAAG